MADRAIFCEREGEFETACANLRMFARRIFERDGTGPLVRIDSNETAADVFAQYMLLHRLAFGPVSMETYEWPAHPHTIDRGLADIEARLADSAVLDVCGITDRVAALSIVQNPFINRVRAAVVVDQLAFGQASVPPAVAQRFADKLLATQRRLDSVLNASPRTGLFVSLLAATVQLFSNLPVRVTGFHPLQPDDDDIKHVRDGEITHEPVHPTEEEWNTTVAIVCGADTVYRAHKFCRDIITVDVGKPGHAAVAPAADFQLVHTEERTPAGIVHVVVRYWRRE